MSIGCVRVAAMAAAVTALIHPVHAQDGEVTRWRVEGQGRRAIVYSPPAARAGGRAPLVLAFHGHGDFMENFQYTDLHRAWPEAVVVYFQGMASRDGLPGWQVDKGQDDDRDLKLVDAALASLREQFRIDDARIYATGFSNGAGFTYLLWAERASVFAAFAPVAGRLRPSVRPTQPRPLFHIVGSRDRSMFAARKDAIDTARRVDGVADAGAPCGDGCTVYGRASAAPVMLWVHGGGHDYPDGTSDRIVAFFRDHPRRP